MRPVFDPTGGPDVLVEKMVGKAYDTVRRVSLSLPELKRLDGVLEEIPVLANDSVAQELASQLPDVLVEVDSKAGTAVTNHLNEAIPPIMENIQEKVAAIEVVAGDVNTSATLASSSAVVAERVAAEATLESGRATQEANRAEQAATVARLSSDIFDTVELGILGTVSGGFFSVPSQDSTDYLILYQNVDSVAEERKRYPSSEVPERLEAGDFNKIGMQMVSLSPESGYSWAIVDSMQRAALLIDLTGAVVIPKYPRMGLVESRLTSIESLGLNSESDFTFQEMSPESGFVWAIVDSLGRRALAIDTSGKVVGNFDLSDTVGGLISSSKDLYYLGDSLTNGAGGQTTWREALAGLVSPRNHTNIAIGGQTSPQIVARAGAYVTLLTLENNVIPAVGSVPVVERTISLLTRQGQQSIRGWLSGVYGILTRANDDSYTFTREVVGSAVYVGKKLAFAPDIGNHGLDTRMIFMGANNITRPDEIKRDIAAAVNAMKPVDKRFLIMTPVTGDSRYSVNCEDIEDWASQTYSDRVLKIREFSFQFNDGSVGDLADVANGIIPRSLRIDGIHFTTFFHGKIAELVAAEINRRGW